jgi:glycosyltransferase involved in cell wall biosynthesis
MSVFNDVDRVADAVESIVAQTFRDWKLVIINDGSTDGTSELLDRFAAQDARIRVVHQENTGLTRALITGCEQANGKYIARQDSDDWSHPERLAEQVDLLEENDDIGFVSCWTQFVGPKDEPLDIVTRPSDSALATKQLLNDRQGPPAHGSVMFRKQLYRQVGGYRREFYFGQDSDLWLRMAEHSNVGYVQKVLYQFVRLPGSISGSSRMTQKEFGRLGQACRAARRDGESEQPFLEEAATLAERVRSGQMERPRSSNSVNTAYLLGSQLVQNGDPRARSYLRTVLRAQPWHWRAWVRLVQSAIHGCEHSNAHKSD